MGEKQNQPFQLSFNASLKVDFQGSRVTSDGGLIMVHELDERPGLEKLIGENLSDSRRGKNTQLPLADLLRQSVYTGISVLRSIACCSTRRASSAPKLICSNCFKPRRGYTSRNDQLRTLPRDHRFTRSPLASRSPRGAAPCAPRTHARASLRPPDRPENANRKSNKRTHRSKWFSRCDLSSPPSGRLSPLA
jgi:hypothetical protein